MTWLSGLSAEIATKLQNEVNVAIWDMARAGLGTRLTFINSRLAGLDELNYRIPDADSPADTKSLNPIILNPDGSTPENTLPESMHPSAEGQVELFDSFKTIVQP